MDAEEPDDDAYVRVFDRDPALLDGIDTVTADFLRGHGAVPRVEVPVGLWHPPYHAASARQWLGLLVVAGALARPVRIGPRRVRAILGPGDLLRPWDPAAWDGEIRNDLPWTVLEPVTMAVLDQRFAAVACRTPAFVDALLSRALRRTSQVAAAVAIDEAGDLNARVGALLHHLSSAWPERPPLGAAAIAVVLGADATAVASALERTGRA